MELLEKLFMLILSVAKDGAMQIRNLKGKTLSLMV